jgi:hypothetical protein
MYNYFKVMNFFSLVVKHGSEIKLKRLSGGRSDSNID